MRRLTGWLLGCGLALLCWQPAMARQAAEPDESGLDEAQLEEREGLDEEFALLEEEAVVFSAARHQQDIAESPSAITVITREQIDNTHCSDVTCLLRQVPEVEVRAIMPMYHSVGARALTGELGDKVLVLVDGREVNIEAFGLPLWQALPVGLPDIERIEVIRGPGSALYGANAHSMVVSITTRKPERREAEAYLAAGEHGRTSLDLRLGEVLGDWRLGATGGLDRADDWRIPGLEQRDVYRLRLTADYRPGDYQTGAEAGLVAFEGSIFTVMAPVDLQDAYLAHALWYFRNDFLSAHLWSSLLSSDNHFDLPLQMDLGGGRISLGSFPDQVPVLSSNLDAELQANFTPWTGNLLVAGASYRWLTFDSEAVTPARSNRHRAGIFVHDEQTLFDELHLTLGLRLDYMYRGQAAGGFDWKAFSFSPRLAIVWRFAPSQLVRLAVGRAYRDPSFFNTNTHLTGVEGSPITPRLGEFFERSIGNEELGSESITAFEAGYRGRFLGGRLTVEADAFCNLYRDSIDFMTDIRYNQLGLPDLDHSVMRFENNGHAVNSLGGSVSLAYRPIDQLRLSANYTYRYDWYVGKPLPSGPTDDFAPGQRVSWEPAQLANLAATWISAFGLRAGLAAYVRSASEQYWTADGELFGPRVLTRNPAAVTVSGFVSYLLELGPRRLELGLKVYNLANAGIRDTTAVTRFDGRELGGELMGRAALLYLRGAI